MLFEMQKQTFRIMSSLSVQESFQTKLQFKFWTAFFTSIIFVIP